MKKYISLSLFFCLFIISNLFAQVVNYEILNDEKQRGVKRSVDVRLESRITEANLRELGIAIRNSDNTTYPNTFVLYYLPGMEVGAGAWASTHFRPNLEIQIYGMTQEEYEKMNSAESLTDTSEVVGVWLDERPYVSRRITIVKRNDKYFLRALYSDGSEGETQIVRTEISGGSRFGESSNSEDFYLLRSNGRLELRDSIGLITDLKMVQ